MHTLHMKVNKYVHFIYWKHLFIEGIIPTLYWTNKTDLKTRKRKIKWLFYLFLIIFLGR